MSIMRSIARNAIVCLAAAALAGPSFAAEPKRGGTLIVGGGAGVRHLNPAVQSGGATGVPGTQLFAGLVRIDDKFEPHPYLAKHWEISDDGLGYNLPPRRERTLHDGKPITSEDVAFSLGIVKANHPFGIAMFDAVERVDTPDPHTVVIRLSKPHPALMQALAPLLMPCHPQARVRRRPGAEDPPDERHAGGVRPVQVQGMGEGPARHPGAQRRLLHRGPAVSRPDHHQVHQGALGAHARAGKGRGGLLPVHGSALPRRPEDGEEPRSERDLEGLRGARPDQLLRVQPAQAAVRRLAGAPGGGLRHRPGLHGEQAARGRAASRLTARSTTRAPSTPTS